MGRSTPSSHNVAPACAEENIRGRLAIIGGKGRGDRGAADQGDDVTVTDCAGNVGSALDLGPDN